MLTAIGSTMLLCPKLGTCSMSLSPTSSCSYSKTQHFYLHSLGHRLFSPWNGLRNLGFSMKPKKSLFRIIGIILLTFNFYYLFWVWFFMNYTLLYNTYFVDRKGRCKGNVVYASLFGVGAPEALVIGVVALLVFGPKGLAEVSFISFFCLFITI